MGKIIISKISFSELVFSDKKSGDYVQLPRVDSWPIDETLSFIAHDSMLAKRVVLVSEDEAYNINTLRYYSVLKKQNLNIISASYSDYTSSYQSLKKILDGSDYILMKMEGIPGPTQLNKSKNLVLNNLDYEKWKVLPNNIKLPDGGYLLIFKSNVN